MKKLLLIALVTLMSVGAFAQLKTKKTVLVIQNRASTMGTYVKPYDLIYIIDDSTMYIAKQAMSSSSTGTYLLASPSRYAIANMTTFGGVNPSYYVDTATAQDVHGVKTFNNAPDIKIIGNGGSATYTNLGIGLGVLEKVTTAAGNIGIGAGALSNIVSNQNNTAVGFQALKNTVESSNTAIGYMSLKDNTTGQFNTGLGLSSLMNNIGGISNVAIGAGAMVYNSNSNLNIAIGRDAGSKVEAHNRLFISNKIGGADTAIIYGVMGATPAASTLQLNAAVQIANTLSASTSVRDTANFGTDSNGSRNKYIRKKITGVVAGDRFVVTPVMASTTATPGTAEFLGYYCTTDSLIISRNTATTSGLKVSWIRIK